MCRRIGSIVVACGLLIGSAWPPAVAAADPTGTTSPSGGQQWQLVAEDSFSGSSLNLDHWDPYDGTPSCCVATHWNPDQISQSGGVLKLTSTKQSDGSWLNAGLTAANWPAAVRTYGKYVVTVKLDRGAGISAAALLWPVADVWPPEIDFYEVGGDSPNRTQEFDTLHYSAAGQNDEQQFVYNGDLTQWHTATLIWLPGSITFYLDGQQVGQTITQNVPNLPMWPAFQMQVDQNSAGQPTAAAAGPVSMYVSDFQVFAPTGVPDKPTTTTAPPPTSSAGVTNTTPPGASGDSVGGAAGNSTTPPSASNTALSTAPDRGQWIWLVVIALLTVAALVAGYFGVLAARRRRRDAE